MTRKTVQKHVQSLVGKGLIQAENTIVRGKDGRTRNGNLLYTITPIDQVLKARGRELLGQLKLAETQRKWDERVKRMTARQTAHTEKTTTPNQ